MPSLPNGVVRISQGHSRSALRNEFSYFKMQLVSGFRTFASYLDRADSDFSDTAIVPCSSLRHISKATVQKCNPHLSSFGPFQFANSRFPYMRSTESRADTSSRSLPDSYFASTFSLRIIMPRVCRQMIHNKRLHAI